MFSLQNCCWGSVTLCKTILSRFPRSDDSARNEAKEWADDMLNLVIIFLCFTARSLIEVKIQSNFLAAAKRKNLFTNISPLLLFLTAQTCLSDFFFFAGNRSNMFVQRGNNSYKGNLTLKKVFIQWDFLTVFIVNNSTYCRTKKIG